MGLLEDIYNWVVSAWNWITTKGYELDNWIATNAPFIHDMLHYELPRITWKLDDILNIELPIINLSINDITAKLSWTSQKLTELDTTLKSKVNAWIIETLNMIWPGLGDWYRRLTELWSRYNPFDPNNWNRWIQDLQNMLKRVIDIDIPSIYRDLTVKGIEIFNLSTDLFNLKTKFENFLINPYKWFWDTLAAVLDKFLSPALVEATKLLEKEAGK